MNESIPFFPDIYKENPEKNQTLFLSKIYIHRDLEETVKVYSITISSYYITKSKEQQKLAELGHLRTCFRYSKYLNTDTLDFSVLDYVTTLDKNDPEFLEKIHYKYL